jgi:hypothetical protein
MQTPTAVDQPYEAALIRPRERLSGRRAMAALLSPQAPPELLECFLIHFCSFGVLMTEPVESWIFRAGERCDALGMTDLAAAFKAHAKHEAGHHHLMIEDTRRLVARWNTRRTPKLDADALLKHEKIPAGVARYRLLHEQTIASDAPYGQLAIELEIEALSIRFGPVMLGQCAKVLGVEVIADLSFVNEHVALDAGHTDFNRRLLRRFLESQPSSALRLAAAGAEALAAYGDFLDDCLDAASNVLGLKGQAASLLSWSVQYGFDPSAELTRAELVGLRDRVLSASGRRSFSILADELLTHTTGDRFDDDAWHLVCRDGQGPVSSVRLRPFSKGATSPFEALLPPSALEQLWKDAPRDRCAEVSRWLTTRTNDQRLFARTIAALWALAQSLSLEVAYTWAGSRDGQASALMRMGGKLLRGVEPLASERWSDDLCAVHFNIHAPPPILAPLIKEMAERLKLPNLSA